jgi:cysteine desulfurase family protein (TIGR01976 family)
VSERPNDTLGARTVTRAGNGDENVMSGGGPRDGVASTERIRADFPALERVHAGRAVAYFDGPGGTQVPRAVAEAMVDYLFHHNANTHWGYPTSAETDEMISAARAAFADFLGASPRDIAFGANMTTLTFHLARAIGRGVGPGDELVVTELDHHANVAPWAAIARERGATLRTVRMIPETGQIDWDDLARCLTPRTRVLAIGAASNALGTVTDVARATRMAKEVGALVFVDAVHFAAHAAVDVQAIGCDFLACSAYKFYGPHIGVLFARRALVEALDVPKLLPSPDEAPDRLETGTLDHEGIAGAAAAVEWLAGLAERSAPRRDRLRATFGALHARKRAHFAGAWDALAAMPRVRLYGPPPDAPRTPTLCFTVAGVPSETVVRRLAERALFATHGDFYAATVAERLGHAHDGLVRAGFACYTTEDEVTRLIAGIEEIAR